MKVPTRICSSWTKTKKVEALQLLPVGSGIKTETGLLYIKLDDGDWSGQNSKEMRVGAKQFAEYLHHRNFTVDVIPLTGG